MSFFEENEEIDISVDCFFGERDVGFDVLTERSDQLGELLGDMGVFFGCEFLKILKGVSSHE